MGTQKKHGEIRSGDENCVSRANLRQAREVYLFLLHTRCWLVLLDLCGRQNCSCSVSLITKTLLLQLLPRLLQCSLLETYLKLRCKCAAKINDICCFCESIPKASCDAGNKLKSMENRLPFLAGGVRRDTGIFVGFVTIFFFGELDTTA